jgi:hypothetical protein
VLSLIGVKAPAGGRGGFPGFGAALGTFVVGTGDYLVTMTVGTQTFKQVLHVERVSGGDDIGSPFGDDDEDHDR